MAINIKKGIKAFLIIVFVAVSLCLLYFWYVFYGSSYYIKTKFNKQKWELKPDKRYKMSKSLVQSNILVGKTRNEIMELLGMDFQEGRADCFEHHKLDIYPNECMSYKLGVLPGFKIKKARNDYLNISFNMDGTSFSSMQMKIESCCY